MTDVGSQMRELDPLNGVDYVHPDPEGMVPRIVMSDVFESPRRIARLSRRPRRLSKILGSASVVFAVAGGGVAVSYAVSSPSVKQAFIKQVNSVVAKYGKAVSTRDAQQDCASVGSQFATSNSNDVSVTPKLLASYSSDVTSLDLWIWNEAVPTVAATDSMGSNLFNRAFTTGSTATSVCYFLGAYGENLSSPTQMYAPSSQAVDLVFVANEKAYLAGTMPYPIPAIYETPPAAG